MKNLKSILLSFSLLLLSVGVSATEDCDSVKKIYKAIAEEDIKTVKIMLENGFDPNTICGASSVIEVLAFYDPDPSLGWAILNNNDISEKGAQAAQILFDHGANPDGVSHYTTPMYEILRGIKEHDFRPDITCHKPRLMRLLIKNGADPQKGEWDDAVGYWQPAFFALNNGCGEEVMKEYLKSKPDFFSSGCDGFFYYDYDTWEKAVRYVTKDPSAQPSLKWIMDYFESTMGMPSWSNERSSAIEWLDKKCTDHIVRH